MKKATLLVLIVAMVGIVSIGIAGVSYPYLSQYGPAVVNWGNNVKYGGTLTWLYGANVNITRDFNPFIKGILPVTLIYEPLLYVSMDGNVTDMLGSSYKWADNNLELKVTIRKNVEWSDGTPFTPEDVVFTFNYLKKYPNIDLNGIWSPSNGLESVSASGNTVIFKFSKPNIPIFNIIVGEPMVPEHIWSKITDPSKFENPNPVGTGPFVLKDFQSSAGTVMFAKNQNYWMKGRPYINGIKWRVLNSSTTGLMLLLRHDVDLGYGYVPNVKSVYVSKDPSNNKYWWPVVGNNALYLNDVKYPFNNVSFRKALSMSINRKYMLDRLYFGDFSSYDNPTLITYPLRSWLDPTLSSLASSLIAYNPQKAQKLLASAGFKKNAQGLLTGPNGKVLPSYTLMVVAGWPDWIQGAQILSQEFKKIGLRVSVVQQSYGQYYSSLQTGSYDMAISWLDVGPTPYNAYYYAFDPTQTAPEGKVASTNFSRYTNPLITSALSIFKGTSNPKLQKQAIYSIERVVLSDVPMIALLPVPMWDTYTTYHFTGFPNDSYPYYIEGSFSTDEEMPALNIHLK